MFPLYTPALQLEGVLVDALVLPVSLCIVSFLALSLESLEIAF